jgi:hypothetical protein
LSNQRPTYSIAVNNDDRWQEWSDGDGDDDGDDDDDEAEEEEK